MCAHYHSVTDPTKLRQYFDVDAPTGPAKSDVWPDWRSGKAFATRIEANGGEPLGIAGLWSAWRSPTGEIVSSFTMLTINADDHPLMRNFHRPEDEKRMLVILSPDYFDEWLNAKPEQSARFLMPYSADQLIVSRRPSTR
jgi:putative SOS response-associated peptidase YedK